MADAHGTPHFHNQPGLAAIKTRAREFMCIGALPPFDHPHIFIDMGDESDIVCSYCSTRFVFDPSLTTLCAPAECLFMPETDAAA
jgi:uncharacterized Zn-finger protein